MAAATPSRVRETVRVRCPQKKKIGDKASGGLRPMPTLLALGLNNSASFAFSTMEEPPEPPESLAMGSSDLRFLLSSHNVVTSEEELTKVLKASFGLDPESSLRVRGQVASYLVAWQTAKTRIKMQAKAEATSELQEWAKPIPQTDSVAMGHAYAKSYGDLEDKQIPSKEYLEKKLHELENGEFRAEALMEVVSRDEVDPDTLMPVWDAKGHITVKRGNTTVAFQQAQSSYV